MENDKKIETERGITNEENHPTPPGPPPSEPAEGRSQQLERIKALRQALLPDAMKGDVRAVGAILKCDEREADLLGIYDEKRENRVVFSWLGEDDERDDARVPVWHTPGECAVMLGVSPKTVRRAVEQGRLPAARTPGGHCRVRQEDLERYRDSTAKKSPEKTGESRATARATSLDPLAAKPWPPRCGQDESFEAKTNADAARTRVVGGDGRGPLSRG